MSSNENESIEGVDLEALSDWMDAQGLPEGPIENLNLLAGGTQNILLLFERGGRSFVLRRPPVHKRGNSDETMRREARVLSALTGSNVPHPGFIAGCGDTETLGASFYLMEPIDGFNPSNGLPGLHESDAGIRREMGLNMARAAATLGELDYQAVGLETFGKVDGFLERQVGRWRSQLESYSELDGYDGPDLPGVEDVARWLAENLPNDYRPGIIHGDLHGANVMFRNDGPELAALVDWELSTVGDPLVDLGWLLATSPDENGNSVGPTAWADFPPPKDMIAAYAEISTRDLGEAAWFEVLACYKLGIILEGTHARAAAGKAPKVTGDLLHAVTVGLFERALTRI